MASKKQPNKTLESLEALALALAKYKTSTEPESYRFAALSKTYEVALEYLWKDIKRYVEDEGLDVASPKEAVRQAARLGLIDDAEKWIMFINARNASVHDYFVVPKKEFIRFAGELITQAKSLEKKVTGKH